MIGMLKNMILYKKYQNTYKTIFIGGFIFKEYEDNSRDKLNALNEIPQNKFVNPCRM